MVSQAWGVIVISYLLDGFPNPRKPAVYQDHTGINKRLTHQLKIYKLKYPPPSEREKSTALVIVLYIISVSASSFDP